MTFLNPAVLIGLAAGAIPILIHLFNLRKLKQIEFSSLQFLKELQKNKIRKVKLKQWLLLLLRTLIVLFIVGAFSRPALRGVAIQGTTSAAKTTSVFIIDDSFSMSALDASGTLFNQSKHKVNECLSILKEGDDAAVIFVSDINKSKIKLTQDINSLYAQIKDANPSAVHSELNEAILKSSELLSESKNFNKELFIFSDFQRSGISLDSVKADYGKLLDKRTQVFLFPFQKNSVFNIGIDSMRINSAILEKGKPLSVSVFVKNYSGSGLNNSVVSIFQNNTRTSQKGITLSAGESKEYILESVLNENGRVEIKGSIEGDDIDADNSSYLCLNIPENISIGIFSRVSSDSRYAELALASLDSSSFIRVTKKDISAFNYDAIDKYSTVFLFGMSPEIDMNKLNSFAESGKGVFIVPSSNQTLEEVNAFAMKFGMKTAERLFDGSKNGESISVSAKADYDHPLFQEIFQKGKSSAIQLPVINKSFLFKSDYRFRPVISASDNSMLMLEMSKGRGKFIVSSFAFVPSWTDFPFKAIFLPFIFRSALYLSSLNYSSVSYYAGEEIRIPIPDAMGSNLKIVKPNKEEESFAAGEIKAKRNIETNQKGVYKFFIDGREYSQIALNHNPAESQCEFMSAEEFTDNLRKNKFEGNIKSFDKNVSAVEAIKQARFGTELWKMMLIIALFLAIIEMWVSKASRREVAELKAARGN